VAESEAIGFVTDLRRRVLVVDVCVLFVILGLAWLTARQVADPLTLALERLRGTAEGLDASSTEFAAVAGSLSDTATDQAASIEETSAAMQGMSGLIESNQRSSAAGREQMRQAHTAVEESFHNLRSLEGAIQTMRETVSQASAVVRSIEEVAFQTGILSLNAAVEAARAGEAGAGFGVVAEEVRHLADRAAKAALETRELIERTIKASELTDDGFGGLSNAFGRIQQSTSSMLTMIEATAKGTEEQTVGIHQIRLALQRMENEAQQTSENAGRSSEAGQRLTHFAADNREVVAELEALLKGAQR
jgi:methyl-accepting chemotaxis protein